jgi:excisionase family DNA binding protein
MSICSTAPQSEGTTLARRTAEQPQLEPLAYTVAEASRVARLGQTTLFALISSGRLASSKVGRKRLIHADSLRKLIAEGA